MCNGDTARLVRGDVSQGIRTQAIGDRLDPVVARRGVPACDTTPSPRPRWCRQARQPTQSGSSLRSIHPRPRRRGGRNPQRLPMSGQHWSLCSHRRLPNTRRAQGLSKEQPQQLASRGPPHSTVRPSVADRPEGRIVCRKADATGRNIARIQGLADHEAAHYHLTRSRLRGSLDGRLWGCRNRYFT